MMFGSVSMSYKGSTLKIHHIRWVFCANIIYLSGIRTFVMFDNTVALTGLPHSWWSVRFFLPGLEATPLEVQIRTCHVSSHLRSAATWVCFISQCLHFISYRMQDSFESMSQTFPSHSRSMGKICANFLAFFVIFTHCFPKPSDLPSACCTWATKGVLKGRYLIYAVLWQDFMYLL